MFKRLSRTAVMTLALSMVLAVSAFALNYSGGGTGNGNKSFCFFGYELVDSTHIKLFFNKTFSSPAKVDINQFSYKTHPSGTAVAFSHMSTASGSGKSGCGDTNLTSGSTVYLTTDSALSADTQYDVTVTAATLADNNKLTLGNYTNKADLVFTFKTKNDSNAYTGTPLITLLPANSSTVSRENNVMFVVDRPVKESEVSGLLSNLNSNFSATKDSVIDSTAVEGAVCYTAHANAARTAFFFPETGNGSSTIAYNLASNGSYTLTVPSFYDVNDNQYSGSSQISFSSWTDDIATWTDAVPTITGLGDTSFTVNWVAGTINTPATYFNVWYTTDSPYAPVASWTKANSTPVTGSSPYSYQITTGLNSCTTYYIRIEPVDSSGNRPAGFSEAVTTTTTGC